MLINFIFLRIHVKLKITSIIDVWIEIIIFKWWITVELEKSYSVSRRD